MQLAWGKVVAGFDAGTSSVEVEMVRRVAFVAALTFPVQAVAAGPPGLSKAGTLSRHVAWSRKFVHEPNAAGSPAGGTLRDADTRKCIRPAPAEIRSLRCR